MAQLARNTSHVADGLVLFLEQFKGKPRFAAILTAFLTEGQRIENAFYDLLIMRTVDNPSTVGAQLDVIGGIVGQAREGHPDDAYRGYLRARIRANRSRGTIEDLIEIVMLILGSGAVVRARSGRKFVQLEVDNFVAASPTVVFAEFLEKAKAAGDELRLVFSTLPSGSTLKLGSSRGTASFASTPSQRPGSIYTVDVGGGALAGVYG